MILARRRSADLRNLLSSELAPVAWHTALLSEIDAGLGPAHAAVLTAPVLDGADIVWSAPGRQSRAFAELSAAERRDLTTALGVILSDIRRLAESGAAPMLVAAWPALREVPDFDAIFAVDGRPVLTAWGHIHSQAERLPGLITRFDDGRARIAPARFPAWSWALAGGALASFALAAGLLLPFAGRSLVPLPAQQCRIAPASLEAFGEATRVTIRRNTLEAELALVEQERGRRRIACPLPQAPPTRITERQEESAAPPAPLLQPRRQPPPQARPASAPLSPDAQRAEQAGGRSGALQIILAWDDTNDLDLFITCPNGQRLGPDNLHACGGTIDLDANRGGANRSPSLTRTPVENAVWAQPSPGRYRIHVNGCCITLREPPRSAFRVTIRQAGPPDRAVQGYAQEGGVPGGPGPVVAEVMVDAQ